MWKNHREIMGPKKRGRPKKVPTSVSNALQMNNSHCKLHSMLVVPNDINVKKRNVRRELVCIQPSYYKKCIVFAAVYHKGRLNFTTLIVVLVVGTSCYRSSYTNEPCSHNFYCFTCFYRWLGV